jgi:hypothetical protein
MAQEFCSKLTTEYNSIPTTFGEFLNYINNPAETIELFKKYNLSVICYTNNGEGGIFNYFPNIANLMEIAEGSVNFNIENFKYQHVLIVNIELDNIQSSSITLVTSKARKPIVIPQDVAVDLDLLNQIKSELTQNSEH